MFKFSWKFRKILRKIYHFIGFMSLFLLFISPVKADEVPSCFSEYFLPYEATDPNVGRGDPVYWDYTLSGGSWNTFWMSAAPHISTLKILIPYEVGTPIYIRFPNFSTSSVNIWGASLYDQYKQWASSPQTRNLVWREISSTFSYSYDSSIGMLTITPISATYYNLNIRYISISFDVIPYGTTYSGTLALSTTDLSTCPGTPTPPTPPSNEVYDSFLDVFLDRFSYLATNFTSNPYLFAFVGILMSWVILELFLRIFHIRGGYKK